MKVAGRYGTGNVDRASLSRTGVISHCYRAKDILAESFDEGTKTMLTIFVTVAALSGGVPVCSAAAPPASVNAVGKTDFRSVYAKGKTYVEFRDAAKKRKKAWKQHYADAQVPDALTTRMAAVPGQWRLLVVAEDWCGDSANTIPYVAKLVDGAGNLEMRIIDSELGREIMESHRTPDGRAATPTVLLLDEAFEEVGCWVERPRKLQAWFLENEPKLDEDTLHEQKYAWYDSDRGRETLREIVELIEAAGAGEPRCGN